MPPFNISRFFSWLLRLSTFTFTLLFGHHLLCGRQIFTKWRSGKHSADHRMISTQLMVSAELTKSFSISTELWNVCENLKCLFLKFPIIFKIYCYFCLYFFKTMYNNNYGLTVIPFFFLAE
jgi:hypothetical protein